MNSQILFLLVVGFTMQAFLEVRVIDAKKMQIECPSASENDISKEKRRDYALERSNDCRRVLVF
jgi:hypothetical protein